MAKTGVGIYPCGLVCVAIQSYFSAYCSTHSRLEDCKLNGSLCNPSQWRFWVEIREEQEGGRDALGCMVTAGSVGLAAMAVSGAPLLHRV